MKVVDEKDLVKKFYHLQNTYDNQKEVSDKDLKHILSILKTYGRKILGTGKFSVIQADVTDIASQYAASIVMKVKLGKFPRININFPILVYLYKVMYSIIDEFYNNNKDNRRHISTNELDFIDNLLYSQNRYSKPVGLSDANNRQVAEKVIKWLKIFYRDHDIRRIFPLSYNYINFIRSNNKNADVSEEVAEFTSVLVSAISRVREDYGDFSLDMEKSNILNTYSMLKILNSDVIDNKLFLATDLGSIYRMSVLQDSGHEIKIPKLDELNKAVYSKEETLSELVENFSITKISNITSKIEKKPFLYKLLLTPGIVSATINSVDVNEKYQEFLKSIERYYDEQNT